MTLNMWRKDNRRQAN